MERMKEAELVREHLPSLQCLLQEYDFAQQMAHPLARQCATFLNESSYFVVLLGNVADLMSEDCSP